MFQHRLQCDIASSMTRLRSRLMAGQNFHSDKARGIEESCWSAQRPPYVTVSSAAPVNGTELRRPFTRCQSQRVACNGYLRYRNSISPYVGCGRYCNNTIFPAYIMSTLLTFALFFGYLVVHYFNSFFLTQSLICLRSANRVG